jgi:hypothetical protein
MQEESRKRIYDPKLYGRVYLASLQDKRVQSLSNAAFRAYIAITASAVGNDESDAYTAHLLDLLGWSDGYLRAAVRELVAAGLIERQVNRASFGSDGHHPNRWLLLGVRAGKWAPPKTGEEGGAQCTGRLSTGEGGELSTGTQDPAENLFSGSTHSTPADKSAAAVALVSEWLLVQKINRKPFVSEVAFARKVLTSYETKDEAYQAIRQGMLLLENRGLLSKTLTFNGLKLVLGGGE